MPRARTAFSAWTLLWGLIPFFCLNGPLGLAEPLSLKEQSLTDHAGAVFSVQGEAQLLKRDSHLWVPLKAGDRVEEGDQIKTNSHASVDIHFDLYFLNRSRIEADTLTTFLSIEPTQMDLAEGALLNLLDGLPSGSPYEVKTPKTVASAQGAHFWISYQSGAQTQITSVAEGTVNVFSFEPELGQTALDRERVLEKFETLEQNFKSDSKSDPWVTEPRMLATEELAAVQSRIDESNESLASFAGGPDALDEAKAEWLLLKEDPLFPSRQAAAFKDRPPGTPSATAPLPEISEDRPTGDGGAMAPSEDAVRIHSAVVQTEEEELLQNTLAEAEDAELGGGPEAKERQAAIL